jgi:hypothetical protein
MLYRKKPTTVDAEQFTDVENPPRGVKTGNQSNAVTRWHYVMTIQGQRVEVKLGEWIIAEPDGEHFYPCDDAVFRQRYEREDGSPV